MKASTTKLFALRGCLLSIVLYPVSIFAMGIISAPSFCGFPDTESSTNIVVDFARQKGTLFKLYLELDAAQSNNMDVAFGRDQNLNSCLDRSEVDAVIGWDCGSWFYQDKVSKTREARPQTAGYRKLHWRLTLTPEGQAKSLKATDAGMIVFEKTIPSTMFNPTWDMMQITARGLAECHGVVFSEISHWGFKFELQ